MFKKLLCLCALTAFVSASSYAEEVDVEKKPVQEEQQILAAQDQDKKQADVNAEDDEDRSLTRWLPRRQMQ